jgi:hypothetical protein
VKLFAMNRETRNTKLVAHLKVSQVFIERVEVRTVKKSNFAVSSLKAEPFRDSKGVFPRLGFPKIFLL